MLFAYHFENMRFYYVEKAYMGASEMAQPVKGLAIKSDNPDNLSLILGTNKPEGENQLQNIIL